jgi:TolB-like protein/lipopolysaccharide biosynthesis regulator YciM
LRYHFEDCVLDTDQRELRRGPDLVSIAPQVFDLLAYLIRNRERVVSKDDLIAAIWEGRIVSDAALTTRLNVARSSIGDSGEEQRLIKTFARKGVRFVGQVRERAPTPGAGEPAAQIGPALVLPDKPSVAVLPFANLSSDTEQEYFSDGITDDIITELSRFSELFVIARNSSFQFKGTSADVRRVGRELGVRYVLEGSIRRAGESVRISAQLVDASTGAHLWAERYDRRIANVFAIQDEVARAIVPLLVAYVHKAEVERSSTRPPAAWEAYDHFLKASAELLVFQSTIGKEDLYRARSAFEQAVQIDPNYARAHAGLAQTYELAWLHNLDGDYLSPAALNRAHALASRAVQLDPLLPKARAELGMVATCRRQHAFALEAFERAFALNPNYCDWRYCLALNFDGQFARGVEVAREYIRSDPFYQPGALGFLGMGLHMLKRYDEALTALREFSARAPNHRAAHLRLAAVCARLGMMDEARQAVGQLLRLDPGHRIQVHVRAFASYREQAHNELFWEELRMAGLPD